MKERDSTREELETLRKEKQHIERCLEAMSQDLKAKQKELNFFAVSFTLFHQVYLESLLLYFCATIVYTEL